MPTAKEAPKDAETISHKLMSRAGLIDKTASGVYTYLPAGYRVLRKVENIVRREMDRTGAIELLMPALQPANLWQETGRLNKMGPEMIRFIDRHNRLMLFGPTHEEVITDIVRKNFNSWKHLPVTLYQIQTKFRDEMRPRFGIIRSREFLMKDAYSFDVDEQGLELSYARMKETYEKIFTSCGLKFCLQQADSGVIGGKFSEEFVAQGECPELEIGHIFKLGTQYSELMRAVFVDNNGKEKPFVMGCYGIGVSRIVAAAIEGNYDEKGIRWPLSIAPFVVLIVPTNIDNTQIKESAEKIYRQMQHKDIEVLIDDRNESVGSKFADGDLSGIPLQIIIGKKACESKGEIKIRKENRLVEVTIDNITGWIEDYIKQQNNG